MINSSGIYKIINLTNNKIYIGSAVYLRKRYNEHFNNLLKNKHENQKLQNAYNKYGLENFKFEKLVSCPREYLIKLEQWFINNMKPEYNISKVAGSQLGFKHSNETKQKISLLHKGKPKSLETKLKMKNYKKSEEHKMKIGAKRKGKSEPKHLTDLKCKKVLKFSLNNELLQEFDSLKEAAFSVNKSTTTLGPVCLNKKWAKTSAGFKWKYKEDYEKEQLEVQQLKLL